MKLSLKDILILAGRRKSPVGFAVFILQGLIFFPFLKWEELSAVRKNNSEGSLSSPGDDVYPLF